MLTGLASGGDTGWQILFRKRPLTTFRFFGIRNELFAVHDFYPYHESEFHPL